MAEPATTLSHVIPAATASYGLTILGIATGLDPGLLFAGLAGGWWALSYAPRPMPLLHRATVGSVSALAGAWGAAWGAPVVSAWLSSTFARWWPTDSGVDSLRFILAMLLGLLAHRHLGPLILRRAERFAESEEKS